VLLGAELDASSHHLREYLAPLVERMLQLRAQFRKEQKWSEADGIRDILLQANIRVEDTEDGFRWQIINAEV
jgi:cysteinyl-tRNA synthetase